ncbi:MAG: EF-hand domain-containing protein [Desulfovibrio sp.]
MPVKRSGFCLVFVLALCLLFPLAQSAALAQDAPPHEGEGVRRPVPAPAAKAQARAQKASAVTRKVPAATAGRKVPAAKRDAKPPLRSVDANHDGRVTREEFLAGTKKRFAKADANRDGVISAQEAKAAKLALQQKRAKAEARRQAKGKPVKPRKSGASSKPYLSALDANKDGRVSQKEYLARREKKFKEMDVNRDGVVSREEARSAKTQAQQRREAKKAQAPAKRQRRAEAARRKSLQAGMSSPGPEYVGTVTPPPAPPAETLPVQPPAQFDLPLTPIAPGVPAHAEPET